MKRQAVWTVLFAGWFANALAGTRVVPAAEEPVREWDSRLLRDANAWPHAEKDARIAATPRGLRVEVAEGRTFAIAAASRLTLPADTGIIRVRATALANQPTSSTVQTACRFIRAPSSYFSFSPPPLRSNAASPPAVSISG